MEYSENIASTMEIISKRYLTQFELSINTLYARCDLIEEHITFSVLAAYLGSYTAMLNEGIALYKTTGNNKLFYETVEQLAITIMQIRELTDFQQLINLSNLNFNIPK
jgi:hypothetical protein